MKTLGDYKMSDEQLLEKINNILNTDYPKLSVIPTEKLKRAYVLLRIAVICSENHVSIFNCKDVGEL